VGGRAFTKSYVLYKVDNSGGYYRRMVRQVGHSCSTPAWGVEKNGVVTPEHQTYIESLNKGRG